MKSYKSRNTGATSLIRVSDYIDTTVGLMIVKYVPLGLKNSYTKQEITFEEF